MSDVASLASITLRVPTQTGREPDLATAAKEFEAYFFSEMLRIGMQPLGGDREGLMDGGHGGRMARDLYHQELARIASERGSLNLGEVLVRQLGSDAGSDEPAEGQLR